MMTVLGVYPVNAQCPCYLLEVQLNPPNLDYEWGKVTQEEPGQSNDNWQVPWDERPLDNTGSNWAFFFHYLDSNRPLLTPDGPVALPSPTPIPKHLTNIEYDEP